MKPTTAMLLAFGGIVATVALGRWYLLPVSLFTAFFAFGWGLEAGRRENAKTLSVLKQHNAALACRLIRGMEERFAGERSGKGAPDVRTHDPVN